MSLFRFGDKEEKSQADLKLTGDIARKCLSMEQFRQYREYYERAEASVIDELLNEALAAYGDGDLAKFGSRCLIKLTRLRDLRSLLTKVAVDSRKGLEEKKAENV